MIYAEVAGGPELLEWCREVPSFHDAEILNVCLRREGKSTITLHWNAGEFDEDRNFIGDRRVVVTLTLEGIMDVQLDGFSPQNVIGGLYLRRAIDRGRGRSYPIEQHPDDIEIELEPCYGLDGVIRAKKVSITFTEGAPDRPDLD